MYFIEEIAAEGVFRFDGSELVIPGESGLWMVLGENRDSTGGNSNGAGKTALFNTVSWVVTGQIPGKSREVLTIGGSGVGEGFVKLRDNETIVDITRKTTKSGTRLFVEVNGDEIEGSGDGVNKPQAELNKLLGIPDSSQTSFEAFLNSIYLSFQFVRGFADSETTSADRVKLLSKYLSLDPLDLALISLRKKMTDLEKEVAPERAVLEELESNKEEYKGASTNFKLAQAKESKLQKDWGKVAEQIANLPDSSEVMQNSSELKEKLAALRERELSELDPLRRNFEELETELEELPVLKERLAEQKKTKVENPDHIQSEIDALKESVEKSADLRFEIHSEVQAHRKTKGFYENLLTRPVKCPECRTKLLIKENSLSKFDEAECQTQIDVAKKALDKAEFDYEERKKFEQDAGRKISDLKVKKVEAEVVIADRKSLQERIEKLKEKAPELEIMDSRGVDLSEEINGERVKIQKELDKLSDLLEEALQLGDEKKILLGEQERLRKELQEASNAVTLARDRKRRSAELAERIKEAREAIEEGSQLLESYRQAIAAVPRFRAFILENALKQIELEANRNLDLQGSSLRVLLSVKVGKKVDLIIDGLDEHGVEKPFSSFSSGESERISLAISFALRDLAQQQGSFQLACMFMDEVFDGLDEEGRAGLIHFLQGRDDQYFIASHGGVDELVSNTIMVIREESASRFKVN